MPVFLIDGDKSFSYNDLLSTITEEGLFAYFSNLVKALANNAPIVLSDSDLGPEELAGVDDKRFETIESLIGAVKKSTSQITIFTSGTTGQPKKVVHNVQTLTRAVRCGERYHGQVWAYAYNPTHMAGLQVFFQAFENQNTLVNVFNKSRAEVYKCIERHHITHISATPTFYRLLLPVETKYPDVQRVTLGGEKSDQKLHESIRQIFPNAKINNVYASTEAGSLFAAKGEAFQIPQALRGKFKVEEDELLIHRSLLGESDSFKFENDYYHSGDLIEWVDEKEGLFRFKNRKNELINVGGYKVNPAEVEEAINAIKGVRQSLVYGKANSVLGNVLCAEVQLEDNIENLTELDIRKFLKERLQDYKIPRKIKFVESFTLTRTGKLKRS